MRETGNVGRRAFLKGGAVASGLGVAGLAVGAPADAGTPKSAAGPKLAAAVVGSDDPRYGDLIVGNNARWVAHPDSIVLAGETSQVAGAVQQAVS
ncbi:MAG: hypothetical protein QOE23_1794, partial [Pseudonocardiales bacterium]|nr:hypothetical protein [Pseudonocardiales bacterium]